MKFCRDKNIAAFAAKLLKNIVLGHFDAFFLVQRPFFSHFVMFHIKKSVYLQCPK
jgi:hypothetical protein